ncbi:phosphate acyltransferase [Limnochorda pilosa]|uniref:Phosphate acyltransferase n=1 Tax=Limnochorda pilosa TaxID=1555112 RepID=A0A0K2SIX1_LIMPI|nr:phosphate acyltransferase [Limnochorda pilosa]
MRVAVDCMAGDHAPAELVAGALAAQDDGVEPILVGVPEQLLPFLPEGGGGWSLEPSGQAVAEGEAPAQAFRRRPDASVFQAVRLVREGRADAAVSVGNTGAAVVAAAHVLGMLAAGRPWAGGPVIGFAPRTVVLDMGANVDVRPAQFLELAAMGTAYARAMLDVAAPRVALLSIGREQGKGNRQVKEAYDLLAGSAFRFVGNVEPYGLLAGDAEVVLCDGFVGNAVLKTSEALSEAILALALAELSGRAPEADLARFIRRVREHVQVAERMGGGPLLGVRGVVVVGHGASRVEAVRKAISTARDAVRGRLVERMEEELRRLSRTEDRKAESRSSRAGGNARS